MFFSMLAVLPALFFNKWRKVRLLPNPRGVPPGLGFRVRVRAGCSSSSPCSPCCLPCSSTSGGRYGSSLNPKPYLWAPPRYRVRV